MTEEINKKARELVEKYDKFNFQTVSLSANREQAKQCALIAVDEIIKSWPHTYDLETEYTKFGDEIKAISNVKPNTEYWIKVKQAIENL